MSTKKHKKAGKRLQKKMRKTKRGGGLFGKLFGKTTPVPPPDLAQTQIQIIKKVLDLADIDDTKKNQILDAIKSPPKMDPKMDSPPNLRAEAGEVRKQDRKQEQEQDRDRERERDRGAGSEPGPDRTN